MNLKISCAVATVLAGTSHGAFAAVPATGTEAETEGLAEITVTAQRRTENIQDVPIKMQA
jgi:outer membrane receptor protein involved in Fe transport